MKIEQHCQTNSHFIYANKISVDHLKHLQSKKIKLDEKIFNQKIEALVFADEEIYIKLETDKGEFLFTNVTNEYSTANIVEILKNNSKLCPTYFFSNVDYFSYGAFGYAENGKIVRYLKVNSEAMGDEEIVDWIGKPHKWEYETHTFYTKQKLEDFEMSFDTYEICEMVKYYLPFIHDDLKISKIVVFTKDLKKIEEKICPKNEIKKKIKEKFDKINKNTKTNILKIFEKYSINTLTLSGFCDENEVLISNVFLNQLTDKEDFLDCDVLHSNLTSRTEWKDSQFKSKFHNQFILLLEDLNNVKPKKIREIANLMKQLDKEDRQRFYIVLEYDKDKVYYNLIFGENRKMFGSKFNKKTTQKILTYIKKDMKKV